MSVKITNLEIENVKRVKAVSIDLNEQGVVIGGNNCQGKTSVLDAICATLGGQKYVPTDLKNHDTLGSPRTKITLNNGLVVERTGKNFGLKVTDPSGQKAGQKLLDSFVGEFALNVGKFMAMSNLDRTKMLVQNLGIEDDLNDLNRQEQNLMQERLVTGREKDRLKKYAGELQEFPEAGMDIQSAAELSDELVRINAHNADVAIKHHQLESINEELRSIYAKLESLTLRKDELITQQQQFKNIPAKQDSSPVVAKINTIEEQNDKVRCNLEKERAMESACLKEEEYNSMTKDIEDIRQKKLALLSQVKMPIDGLTIVDGDLRYNDESWDCMSGMERIKVSVALAKMINPECGFVLLDGLEAFDTTQLAKMKDWMNAAGLQFIATRVSQGDECSIIIDDGLVTKENIPAPAPAPAPKKEIDLTDIDMNF